MKEHHVNIPAHTFAEIEAKRQTAIELLDSGYIEGDKIIMHEHDEATMVDLGGELKITITGIYTSKAGNSLISFDPSDVEILS
jgi:hypothetical protein